MKKLISLLSILVISLSVAVNAFAVLEVPRETYAYMSGKRGGFAEISFSGFGQCTVSAASVKSSKRAVATINFINVSYELKENPQYTDGFGCFLQAELYKPGTTIISLADADGSYQTKLNVLKYINPVASLKVTGINNDKEMKNLFTSENNVSSSKRKITKTVTSPVLKAKAISGWKIVDVTFKNWNTGESRSFGFIRGKSSVTLHVPAFRKNDYVEFRLTYYNSEKDIYQYIFYGY